MLLQWQQVLLHKIPHRFCSLLKFRLIPPQCFQINQVLKHACFCRITSVLFVVPLWFVRTFEQKTSKRIAHYSQLVINMIIVTLKPLTFPLRIGPRLLDSQSQKAACHQEQYHQPQRGNEPLPNGHVFHFWLFFEFYHKRFQPPKTSSICHTSKAPGCLTFAYILLRFSCILAIPELVQAPCDSSVV